MSLEDRLENWAMVMRVRKAQGRCGSAEGRYIPERLVGEQWDSRRTPKPSLDTLDASLVEAAWREMEVRLLKNLLALHYVYRAPRAFICRRQGIPYDRDGMHYEMELRRAHAAIGALLLREHNILRRNDESPQLVAL